jgi:hypothetical protein
MYTTCSISKDIYGSSPAFTEKSKITEFKKKIMNSFLTVPDSKSRNIPEVVFARRWAVGVLGIWKGWDSWVKGGANRVSLQAT